VKLPRLTRLSLGSSKRNRPAASSSRNRDLILVKIGATGLGYLHHMATQAFKVVKDAVGWTVCFGEAVTSSFRTRRYAIQEARRLCDSLRMHGLDVAVMVEDEGPGAAESLLRGLGAGPIRS